MNDETKEVPVKKEGRRGGLFDSPLEPLAHLREEMDRLFDDVTSSWPWGGRRRRHGMSEPFRGMMEPFRGFGAGWGAGVAAFDVVDKEKEIQIRADLPGLDEKDIEVRLSDGILTVQGEKKEETEEGEKGTSYYLSERRYGAFQRSFRVPEGVDVETVDASFKKGVLTITLPKTKEAQERVKKIEVKGES